MHIGKIFAGLVIASLVSTPAYACRSFTAPADRIERGYDTATIKAAAIVVIESATHTNQPSADIHPWKATARVVQPANAPQLPESIEFERGWGSSACEWNLPPLPETGDRWMVYFWVDNDGEYRPWLAMTEAEAREFDPRANTITATRPAD